METVKKIGIAFGACCIGLFNIAMGINMKQWVFIAGGIAILAIVFILTVVTIVEKIRGNKL